MCYFVDAKFSRQNLVSFPVLSYLPEFILYYCLFVIELWRAQIYAHTKYNKQEMLNIIYKLIYIIVNVDMEWKKIYVIIKQNLKIPHCDVCM